MAQVRQELEGEMRALKELRAEAKVQKAVKEITEEVKQGRVARRSEDDVPICVVLFFMFLLMLAYMRETPTHHYSTVV